MNTKAVYHLFVYGSLRKGFQSPVYEYISQFFEFVGDATVRGRLYDLGTYPAAVPTTEEAFITGELYRIRNEHEFSWAMGQLDDYEGLTVEAGETPLYRRDVCAIRINGQEISAWVYWFNGDVSAKPVIASGDMMEYLNQNK